MPPRPYFEVGGNRYLYSDEKMFTKYDPTFHRGTDLSTLIIYIYELPHLPLITFIKSSH